MLSSLPCNYRSLWFWMLSTERMCQLIRVWIQQSITHQQWQSTKTWRQSSVNRSTAAHPFTATHTHTHTHLSSKYNYPRDARPQKLDTHGHVRNQTHYDVDTDVHTGVSGESPESPANVCRHTTRGAKTTGGHMIRRKPTDPPRCLPRRSKHYQMCLCKVYLEFRTLLASAMLLLECGRQNPATEDIHWNKCADFFSWIPPCLGLRSDGTVFCFK